MKKIEVNYKDYKKAVIDIFNLNIPQLKSKYSGDITYIFSFIHELSLGYSSKNYIYIKKAAGEANFSIDVIINKSRRLVNELSTSADPKDYYKILEVTQSSTSNEIRDNWIRLVKENHPDIKGDLGAEFTKELNEAYNILSNKNTRSVYNASYFHYLPLNVKKTKHSFLENKIFLLASSFIIIFLLGFFVNGFFEESFREAGGNESKILNPLNSEGLNSYAEVDSEVLE
ncbi:MAG: J domain-containing protein, partial [Thermodesulfobacteriota bacterium]